MEKKMNKNVAKRVAMVMLVAITMLTTVGCAKEKIEFSYDSGDYIDTLGQYKGVEYKPVKTEITEEQIQRYLDIIVDASIDWKVFTNRNVAMGDKVNIQISAVDAETGEYIPGFSVDEDYSLVLGSGKMSDIVENFEEQVVGTFPGYTSQFTCKVTDNFTQDETLVGKDVIFTVTVIDAFEGEKPELTDALVEEYTSGKYKTVEAFKKYKRDSLKKMADEADYSANYLAVMDKIIEDTKFSSYPEAELAQAVKDCTESFEVYALYKNMSAEEYCEQEYGVSIEEYCKRAIKTKLIIQEVIKKENITITTSYYNKHIKELAEKRGYSDVEAYEEKFERSDIVIDMAQEKAQKLIMDSTIEKE